MTEKELYDMELHQVENIPNQRTILRVVDGWIYYDYYNDLSCCGVFVRESTRVISENRKVTL